MRRSYKNKPITEVLEDNFYHFFDKEGDGAPDEHAYDMLTKWVMDNHEQYLKELLDEQAVKILFKTVEWGRWDDFQKMCRVIRYKARMIGNDLSLDHFEYLNELYWADQEKGKEHARKTAEDYAAKMGDIK